MTVPLWRRAHALVVVGVVMIIALGLGARRVEAHASLESTDPTPDSLYATSPPTVSLQFSEAVNTVDGSLRVVAPDGSDVAITGLDQRNGDASIVADLPPLGNGTYIVAWKAISADSHPVSGAFSFSVGAPSANAAGSAGDLAKGESHPAADAVLAVGRSLAYGGLALLTGVAMVAPLATLSRRRVTRTLWGGLVMAIVGTLAMIAGESRVATDGWFAWGTVVGTDAGRWWLLRIALLALSAPLVVSLTRATEQPRRTRTVLPVVIVWSVALSALVAAGGHGRTGEHAALGFTATVVHLVAMSLWIGGIATLLLAARDERLAAAARFSPVALVSVAALVVTGSYNAWRQSSSWAALLDSRYGHALLVKVMIVAAIVAVAGVSRVLTHWAADGASPEQTHRALRRTVTTEAVCFVGVLLATSVLSASPPPREVAAAAGVTTASATVTAAGAERTATATIDTDAGVLRVVIAAPPGPTLSSVAVSGTLTGTGIGPLEIAGGLDTADAWSSDAWPVPAAGRWKFTVVATFGQFDASTFEIELDIPSKP